MNAKGLWYFQLLKQEITTVFQSRHPDCARPFEDWSGRDIADFQEDLRIEVKGRISEKWFYTHLKNPNPGKLPRVDILNLLCQYTGYKSWNDFEEKKGVPNENDVKKIRDGVPSSHTPAKKRGWLMAIGALLSTILVSVYILNSSSSEKYEYTFRFIDADTDMPVTDSKIQITVLREDESPLSFTCDSNGCFKINKPIDKIRFAVKAPYYNPDTVIRNISIESKGESIKLKTDDYALMIHVFSKSNVEDWEKRRKYLNSMLADNVMVIQVSGTEERGMEMYNKEEFIDKLTMPIGSLKNVEVLETEYQNNKISWIRFKQSESSNR